MADKKYGLGPHRIERGVIIKLTTTEPQRDRCFMDDCQNRPKHVISYYNRQVGVCNAHRDLDGIGNS